MARMIGKKQVKDWCGYGCCTTEDSKKHVKREELKQVFKDVEAEKLYEQDCPHVLSVVDAIAYRKACHECHVLAGGEADGY